MKAKNALVIAAGVTLSALVASVVGVGVYSHEAYKGLDHGQPFDVVMPESLVLPASQNASEVDTASLNATLSELAHDPALGDLHGRVTDTTIGETVWEARSDEALVPASSAKVLTAAAALLTLDQDQRLSTVVLAGSTPGTVVIRASGDVWLNEANLDELAGMIEREGKIVDTVVIDTSVWTGPEYAESWDPGNIDAGYIAPMQPAMLYGGRIGDVEGNVPRSHTPAYDVAAALAQRVGASTIEVGTAPIDAREIAVTESAPLRLRLKQMMLSSDNVMAEAIGRETALARGYEASFQGAVEATLNALSEAGFDVSDITLNDNSGLSPNNRIQPRLLDDIMSAAATGTELRTLLWTLPVAHGEGTLEHRFEDLSGRGWVRAKTGTLTGVNALVGTATGRSGHIYTFAFISNNAPILSGREALDRLASVLRDA